MGFLKSLTAIFALSHSAAAVILQGPSPGYEAKYSRYVFYTGGEYISYSDDLYVFNAPTKNGSVIHNQMYVEQLIPSGGVNKTSPLVFLPGAGNLFGGSGWLNTPDNRTGWAGYFLDQGYAVYLIDYPNSGRSSGMPNYYPNTAQLASKNLAAPEKFSDNYPQAVNHTQFPGTGMMGDPIFDAWFASQATLPSNLTALELATRKAMCDLLGRIGPAYLIGADFGGTFMILAADECPELVKGMFGVEPTLTPFTPISRRSYGITNTSLLYDPPVSSPAELETAFFLGQNTTANNSCILQGPNPRKLVNIAKVPLAFYTAEASVSVTFTHCIAAFLRQSGVDFEWIRLEQRGIHGNGYVSVIEKNNLQIAREVLQPWLELRNRLADRSELVT